MEAASQRQIHFSCVRSFRILRDRRPIMGSRCSPRQVQRAREKGATSGVPGLYPRPAPGGSDVRALPGRTVARLSLRPLLRLRASAEQSLLTGSPPGVIGHQCPRPSALPLGGCGGGPGGLPRGGAPRAVSRQRRPPLRGRPAARPRARGVPRAATSRTLPGTAGSSPHSAHIPLPAAGEQVAGVHGAEDGTRAERPRAATPRTRRM